MCRIILTVRDGRGQVRSSAEARFSRPFCISPGTGLHESRYFQRKVGRSRGLFPGTFPSFPKSYVRSSFRLPWDGCIYCGAETSLYVNEQLVCLKCDEDLSKGRNPPSQSSASKVPVLNCNTSWSR